MEKKEQIKNIIQESEQTKKSKLSNDFKVFLKIYETTEVEKDLIYFSKLVKNMDMDKTSVSKSVDKLFDNGLVFGSWNFVYSEKCWMRTFHIEDEALGLAKELFNAEKSKNEEKKEKTLEK